MNSKQLTEAIIAGKLYAADVMADSAYVYYEPTGVEHEHVVHYVKAEGVWVCANGIYGDLVEAVGGEDAETIMLGLLGLIDDPAKTITGGEPHSA
jgi:hypothetical protein